MLTGKVCKSTKIKLVCATWKVMCKISYDHEMYDKGGDALPFELEFVLSDAHKPKQHGWLNLFMNN